uniref:THAP-type domain-containing protein n=1 Tax=Clytia hemisphaerica TaxID=252671 RepID=A0A7M5X526_9CNID
QDCPCKEPFKLPTFPGKKKDPERRKHWRILINRTAPKTNKLWSPGSKSRVCSRHFTESLPHYPSRLLWYNGVEEKLYRMFPEKFAKRRKFEYKPLESLEPLEPLESLAHLEPSKPSTPDEAEPLFADKDDDISFEIETSKERELQEKIDLLEKKNSELISEFEAKVYTLEKNNSELTKNVKNLTRACNKSSNGIVQAQKVFLGKLCVLRKKCECKKSMEDQLLTSDCKTKFYTGIENLQSFCNLHDLCKPYIMNKSKENIAWGWLQTQLQEKGHKTWEKTEALIRR